MLSNTRIAEFLGHTDRRLMRHAAKVLAECSDPSPVTRNDYERAIDLLGAEDTAYLSIHMQLLPAMPDTVEWLTAQHAAAPPRSETADWINKAIQTIDPPLIDDMMESLQRSNARVPKAVTGSLKQRRSLMDLDPETLWAQLMTFCDRIKGKYCSQYDPTIPNTLISLLSTSHYTRDIAEHALEFVIDDNGMSWNSTYATRLLGHMRYRPAARPLIDLLSDEVEDYGEDLMFALGKIGDADAMAHAFENFRGRSTSLHWYGPGALGRIRSERSEAILLDILEQLDGPAAEIDASDSIRAFTLCALCDLVSTNPETLMRLHNEAIALNYDTMIIDLDEEFWTVATMVGYDFPEKEEWGGVGFIREAYRKSHNKAWQNIVSPKSTISLTSDNQGGDNPMPELEVFPTHSMLWKPKARRNDPCPCGSGKKYKKCCLREQIQFGAESS